MEFSEVLDRAVNGASWDDFGPYGPVHIEGFRQLVKSANSDLELSDDGRARLENAIPQLIVKYLTVERDIHSYPEIKNVDIDRPLMISGFGRTGSTFLHSLLALDVSARAPQHWEIRRPSPPPRHDEYLTDPRIVEAQNVLDEIERGAPEMTRRHPLTAQTPDECHLMMSHGPHRVANPRYPGYWEWYRALGSDDLRALYQRYRRQIQHLQLYCKGHWVSKSFVHEMYSDVLFDVFPGCSVVRLHRDPAECIPSLAGLAFMARQFFYPSPSPSELGTRLLDIFHEGKGRMMRNDVGIRKNQYFDVSFLDLVRDPVGVVKSIYEHFGYELHQEFLTNVRNYIDQESKKQKHRYKCEPEQFGLTRKEIMIKTQPYLNWARDRGIELFHA